MMHRHKPMTNVCEHGTFELPALCPECVDSKAKACADEIKRLNAIGDANRLKDRRERIATAVLSQSMEGVSRFLGTHPTIHPNEGAKMSAKAAVQVADALIAELDK